MGDELLAELARQDALAVRDRYYGWLPEPERTAMLEAMTRIARAGLAARAGHFPEELSGGEMQRVAVARALVGDPEAVLCDEPTGNLDSGNAQEILALLRALPEAGKRAVVMVTHDPAAGAVGDRSIHIHDGRVSREERPAEPGH